MHHLVGVGPAVALGPRSLSHFRQNATFRTPGAKGCEREVWGRCCLAPGGLGESACWCRRGDGLRGLALCRRRRATPDERPGSRTRCGQSSALAASAESRRELRPRGLASRSPARISRSASASSIPRCTAIRRALVSADAVTSTRRMPSSPRERKGRSVGANDNGSRRGRGLDRLTDEEAQLVAPGWPWFGGSGRWNSS